MNQTKFSIAIDGPAGSGKSTVAKEIAKTLHIVYVDTGAMYRTVGYACMMQNVNIEKEEDVVALLSRIHMEIKPETGGQKILLDGEDVTQKIRTQEIGTAASIVASYMGVRETLVSLQKQMASTQSVIMDGRDIGTTVLPDAEVKIYLDASVSERAKRRMGELQSQGKPADFETVKKEIEERDYQDMHRTHSPLKKAENAIVIDTTGKSIAQVQKQLLALIQKRIDI